MSESKPEHEAVTDGEEGEGREDGPPAEKTLVDEEEMGQVAGVGEAELIVVDNVGDSQDGGEKEDGSVDKKGNGGKEEEDDGGKEEEGDGGKEEEDDGGKEEEGDGGKEEEDDGGKEENALGEGDQDGLGGDTLLDDGGVYERNAEEENDAETTQQNGDSHEDQGEAENGKDEVLANEDTELQDEDTELQDEDTELQDEDTEVQDEETIIQQDTPDLSDEEIARLRAVFDRQAVNDLLDLKAFKVSWRLLGEVVSSDEVQDMFEDGDKNEDMQINFDEFRRLYAKFRQQEHDRKQVVLASIDKLFPGNDGESVELRKVEQLLVKLQNLDHDTRLTREKSDLGEDDIRQLVRAMDTDGSGRISRHEFVNALCQHIET